MILGALRWLGSFASTLIWLGVARSVVSIWDRYPADRLGDAILVLFLALAAVGTIARLVRERGRV